MAVSIGELISNAQPSSNGWSRLGAMLGGGNHDMAGVQGLHAGLQMQTAMMAARSCCGSDS